MGNADSASVTLGATKLLSDPGKFFGRARVGLVASYNSVDEHARPIIRLFAEHPEINLCAIYSSEHGLWGCEQAGMKLDHTTDDYTGVSVFSLYGDAVKPTPEMLDDVDIIVCDGNDVGSRYWTTLSTTALVIEAAAEAGKPVILADRPNPLGGAIVDGNLLDLQFRSFVGYDRIPIRHGMTPGELARMFAQEAGLDADLTVIPMDKWRRDMLFPETGHFWASTPNMPGFETALVYPGTCLFEGTTCSEGRGTTKPFRLIGAPWLNAVDLADRLNAMEICGVRFRPVHFRPMFSKHAGEECKGVEVHVTDARCIESVRLGVSMLYAIREQNPNAFQWYGSENAEEGKRLFIDLLSGGSDLRTWIDEGVSSDEIISRWKPDIGQFMNVRQRYLMYV